MSNLSSQTTLLPAYLSLGVNTLTQNPYQTLIPSSTPNPFLPSTTLGRQNFPPELFRPLATPITEPQKTNHQAVIKIGSNTGSLTLILGKINLISDYPLSCP
jgi:hypothetical protein